MAHWFKTLFAATGTKTAVPNAADPSGFISYDTGYGPDYQRVLGTDPLAKTIERDKLNQVLYDITGAVQQYQTHGFPEYIDATANGGVAYAYAIDAIVLFTDGKNYVNTVAANTNAPNVSGWIELGSVSTLVHNMASDADYTLSTTENKYLRINITDTSVFLTTGRNIIVDNSQRRILVVNNTLQPLTFKTSAGTGIAVAAGISADLLCDGTNVVLSISAITAATVSGVRQTAQTASVDANGYANFISIGTGLAVNIAATAIPVKISAAGGAIASDRLGTISTDTSIAGLTGSSTNYLFAEVALNGIVTLGKTVLKPLYQQGGAASIVLNQYTFNISEMKMYVGNGTIATQVYGVFIGHAVTNTTNVTSVVNYALNGEFVTPTSALLVAATITTLNHNLGVKGLVIPILTCLTAQAGYAAGDELPFYIVNSGGAYSSAWSYNEYTASYATIAATLYLVHLGTAAFTTITPANFNVKFKVTRGW